MTCVKGVVFLISGITVPLGFLQMIVSCRFVKPRFHLQAQEQQRMQTLNAETINDLVAGMFILFFFFSCCIIMTYIPKLIEQALTERLMQCNTLHTLLGVLVCPLYTTSAFLLPR